MRQGEESCSESRNGLEADRVSGEGQPDILQKIVGGVLVTDTALEIASHSQFVPSIERIECRRVTARIAPDEDLVVFFRGVHGRGLLQQRNIFL